ncbi:MAG TPA: helix-turn-helix transcriptional regulator [bacterium]|nr:helix-turn-helix transcriptional regulator [bacterium]
MLPFGTCVLLWRNHLHLSQKALAQKAGMPQPNLSDIERGEREVSLRTLRALAQALGIRPGILADGIGPVEKAPPLSRERLEKVADSVVKGTAPAARDAQLAAQLVPLVRPRLAASGNKKAPGRSSERRARQAWLRLAASHDGREIQSLAERIAEKAGRP